VVWSRQVRDGWAARQILQLLQWGLLKDFGP